MAGRNIRMAILDDGVHPEVCSLAGSFRIEDDLSVAVLEDNAVLPDSHGSMCARIVQRYAELADVDVFSIQILQGDTLRGNIKRLLKAFELCVSMDIRLIHLSVGTYAYEDFARLEEAVRRLLCADRLLVAASGNRGTVTYPAYLPGVIGVKYHPGLTDDEYIYCYDSFSRIHFQASSEHKLNLQGQQTESQLSNSYAAPLITAKILSRLKANADADNDEILRLLIENAGNQPPSQDSEPCPYPPVEIPVVLMSGFSAKRLAHLLGTLMDSLRRDDYDARAATNLSGSRPWDETALPGNQLRNEIALSGLRSGDEAVLTDAGNLDEFIARMAWYFSCEIILLGITSYLPPDRCRNVSLWIYGDESDDWQTMAAKADGQVLRVAELADHEVYHLMMDMLT